MIPPNLEKNRVRGQYFGKIERIERGTLLGWLLDVTAIEQPVQFELLLNGHAVGVQMANRLRGDLSRKGIGNGRHGFEVALPRDLLQEGTNRLELLMAALDAPIVVELPFTGPAGPEAQQSPAADPTASPASYLGPIFSVLEKAAQGTAHPAAGAALPLAEPRLVPVLAAAPARAADQPALPHAVRETMLRLVGPGAEEICERITAAFSAGDWTAAERLAREAAQTSPRTAMAQGVALLELGQPEAAEQALRWFEANAPADHLGLYRLGMALEQQQRCAEAAAIYGRCRALKPEEPRYTLQCGRMMARAANGAMGVAVEYPELLDHAMELLEEAAAMMPRDGRPLRDLAQLRLQKGDPEGALALIRRAEERQPDNAAFILERMRLLTRLSRIEEALAAATEALALAPASDAAISAVRVLTRWVAARQAMPWRAASLVPVASGPAP